MWHNSTWQWRPMNESAPNATAANWTDAPHIYPWCLNETAFETTNATCPCHLQRCRHHRQCTRYLRRADGAIGSGNAAVDGLFRRLIVLPPLPKLPPLPFIAMPSIPSPVVTLPQLPSVSMSVPSLPDMTGIINNVTSGVMAVLNQTLVGRPMPSQAAVEGVVRSIVQAETTAALAKTSATMAKASAMTNTTTAFVDATMAKMWSMLNVTSVVPLSAVNIPAALPKASRSSTPMLPSLPKLPSLPFVKPFP